MVRDTRSIFHFTNKMYIVVWNFFNNESQTHSLVKFIFGWILIPINNLLLITLNSFPMRDWLPYLVLWLCQIIFTWYGNKTNWTEKKHPKEACLNIWVICFFALVRGRNPLLGFMKPALMKGFLKIFLPCYWGINCGEWFVSHEPWRSRMVREPRTMAERRMVREPRNMAEHTNHLSFYTPKTPARLVNLYCPVFEKP